MADNPKTNPYRKALYLLIKKHKSDMAKMDQIIRELLDENNHLNEKILNLKKRKK